MEHSKKGKGPQDDSDKKAEGTGKSTTSPTEGATGSTDREKLTRKEYMRIFQQQRGFHPRHFDSDDDDNYIMSMDPFQMQYLMRRMARHPWDNHSIFGGPRCPHSPDYTTQEPPPETKDSKQREWRPPKMVEPDQEMSEDSIIEQHGELETDAELYIVREKNDDEERIHSVLHMPSRVPDKLKSEHENSKTYNILMADVSASMCDYWTPIVEKWNEHVAPNLVGRTNIYVFGTNVDLKRTGTLLQNRDLERGGTDLTGALQTIVNEVYTCKEKYINVFLVTDGQHNVTKVQPDRVISYMRAARGKICDVYILGAGSSFPVKYSVDIRSHLHSGSSNIPTLFWAQSPDKVEEQMSSIASEISSGASQSLKLSVVGSSLPGIDTIDMFHLREWVYFPHAPDQIKEMTLTYGRKEGYITLQPRTIPVAVLSEVFRQWNTVIIQRHSKREDVPRTVLPLMEQLYKTRATEIRETHGPPSISQRLERKEMNKYETEIRTLFNKVKVILTTEKFQNELELAENILSTTVGGGKYNTKALQMKGHTDKDYENDCNEFMKVFDKNKENILALKVTPEDCCRVTLTSTVSDLKDPDLPKIMDLNKFEFLKEFTISGIPVFAPTRDSVAINPWSLSIRRIINEPYTIMSQVALDATASTNATDKQNLKPGDSSTHCNAIVPIFPPNAAKVMAPLVHTRFYAMCSTFAILRNPHVIDFNIHMAALGVTWVRILFEYPTQPRPEFVHLRIESIEATAALYINRPSYAKYLKVLRDDTPQALMTESTLKVDNRTIKCESLIKPIFLLHVNQRCESPQDPNILAKIVRMILFEYIGRCLSNYKSKENDSTPFTDFFAETLADQEKKKEWLQKYVADSKAVMVGSEYILLEEFYTLEMVQKEAKKSASKLVKSLKEKVMANIPLQVNMEKVEKLRNVSGAGDVSWLTLKIYAREVGLAENVVSDLFSEQSVFVYVAHALMHRASRDRLQATVHDYDHIRTLVTKKVQEENSQIILKELYTKSINYLQSSWLETYFSAHREVVQPMTRQEILREASQRGVEVTDATFDQVYKRYRPQLGLLSNACQCRACPYFLIPDKRYNQHASVERRGPTAFPHAFHRTAYQLRNADLPTAISKVESGAYTKKNTLVPKEAVQNIATALQNLQQTYRETAL